MRTSAELDNLLVHADLVRYIKCQRFSWLGHVERMEEKRMPTEGKDARYKEERTSKEALDRSVVFNLFCSRTPRYNFSSTFYPQSSWYIMQVILIV
jgi:hypothetical protein